jgi:hypothetical protein
MTKETRGNIAVISAIAMLSFGMIFTGIGFFVQPLGEVSDSVLWILGQALIYAGSIFGIATYTKGVIIKQVGELEERYKREKKETRDADIEEGEQG